MLSKVQDPAKRYEGSEYIEESSAIVMKTHVAPNQTTK